MAGTYTQLYIQIVFAVKGRENLLASNWRQDLFRYISGIITNKGQKSIIVNGVADHVHILVGLRPTIALSDLVRDIKNNSSKYINEKGWVNGKFQWQSGYGAFSYSHKQVSRVYQYILNQEEHHSSKTFREEYEGLLQDFNIDYQEKYITDT